MRSSTRNWAALLGLFGLIWGAAATAGAQEPPGVAAKMRALHQRVEAQEKQLRAQQAKLDEQGSKIAALEGLPASLDEEIEQYLDATSEEGVDLRYGSGTSLVSIHGFINVEFLDSSSDDSDIDLHHAFLFFSAPVGEVAETWIEVEYEHASQVIHINQAEVRFTPFEVDLTLAAGRFYAPVGIERFIWYPSTNPLVSRPVAFQQIVPGSWYATGVRVDWKRALGESLALRVEAALTDGLGPSAATSIRGARQFRDSNNNKAVSGHMAITWRERFCAGVSGATLKYAGQNRISFLGLDLEGRWRRLLVRAEYVHSAVEDPGGPVGDFDRRGLYVLAEFRLVEQETTFLDLVCRYEWVDLNSKVANGNDLSIVSFGLRWSPAAHVTLKGEVQWFQARHGAEPAADWALFLQAVVDF